MSKFTNNSIYLWLTLNIPFLIILLAGFLTKSLNPVFNDVTYITHFIFGYFLVALFYTFYISYQIEKDKQNFDGFQNISNERLGIILDNRLEFTRFSMAFLIVMGFLGTLVGVMIGFSNVPVSFADAEKMQQFVRQILVGFSTELLTLLVGLAARTWLSIIHFIQERQINNLYLRATQ